MLANHSLQSANECLTNFKTVPLVETLDLTVVIPTYNGAERLPAVLSRLQKQVVPRYQRWEILIVDNNSQDHAAEVIQQWQRSWTLAIPLRLVFEPRQGVTFARQCGVSHARGRLVGFLDDDNWPTPGWVTTAIEFGKRHPDVGAFNGRVRGVFETPPSEPVEAILGHLAIRDHGPHPHPFQSQALQLPAGAGLVIRRQAWLDSLPEIPRCTDRGGNDYEISLHLARQGWAIWYTPQLQIEHFIPTERLQRSYLRSLTHLHGLRTCELTLMTAQPWQYPLRLGRALAGSLHRILKHLLQHRFRSRATLEADCLLAFHLGNLKSPFVYLFRHWF
ncbi:MAG: hormogonium polysaccharide biosynthesis glycosyltransferase HpsE [Cyanobacteria bacterium J06626_18]